MQYGVDGRLTVHDSADESKSNIPSLPTTSLLAPDTANAST
jgi:hypothetical protein